MKDELIRDWMVACGLLLSRYERDIPVASCPLCKIVTEGRVCLNFGVLKRCEKCLYVLFEGVTCGDYASNFSKHEVNVSELLEDQHRPGERIRLNVLTGG